MFLEEASVGQAGERVVVGLILEMLLGALAISEIADMADHAGDRPLDIELRAEDGGDPPLAVAAQDVVVRLVEGNGLAGEGAGQEIVDALVAEVGDEVGGALAEDFLGGEAGELLHESVPDEASQVAVIHHDPLGGVGSDVGGQLPGVALARFVFAFPRRALETVVVGGAALATQLESRLALSERESDGDERSGDDNAHRDQGGGDDDC